jgi:hypothetical protein
MNAFGCTPLANANCIPAVPISGSPIIAESDIWQGLRLGLAGEMMLTDRVKLSGDVAYLPYVTFSGVDNHFLGNTGILASINPENASSGQGVQLEAAASYYFTPQISVGLGGRYWATWTTDGGAVRTFPKAFLSVPPQNFRATFEQLGAFVQLAYRFGNP